MPTNKVKISLYMIISDPNSTVNPDKPLEVGSHCVTALILHNVNNQQYKHVVHYYTICIPPKLYTMHDDGSYARKSTEVSR